VIESGEVAIGVPRSKYYGRASLAVLLTLVWLILVVPFTANISPYIGAGTGLFGIIWLIANARWLFYPCGVSLDVSRNILRLTSFTGEHEFATLGDLKSIECSSFGLLKAPLRISSTKRTIRMMSAPTSDVHSWVDAIKLIADEQGVVIDVDVMDPWDSMRPRPLDFVFRDSRE
jgi:hypothetical protein